MGATAATSLLYGRRKATISEYEDGPLPGVLVTRLLDSLDEQLAQVVTLLNEADKQAPEDPQYLRLLKGLARKTVQGQRQHCHEAQLLDWFLYAPDDIVIDRAETELVGEIAEIWLKGVMQGDEIRLRKGQAQTSTRWETTLARVLDTRAEHFLPRLFGDDWEKVTRRETHYTSLIGRKETVQVEEREIIWPKGTGRGWLTNYLITGDADRLRQRILDYTLKQEREQEYDSDFERVSF